MNEVAANARGVYLITCIGTPVSSIQTVTTQSKAKQAWQACLGTLGNMLPKVFSASVNFCFRVSGGMVGLPVVLLASLPNMAQDKAAAAAALPTPMSSTLGSLEPLDITYAGKSCLYIRSVA